LRLFAEKIAAKITDKNIAGPHLKAGRKLDP
jgi:hypothetical protein